MNRYRTHARSNGRPACDCPECVLGAARRDCDGKLPILVVYDKPNDAPDSVIVRLWLTDEPTVSSWHYATLDDAHRVLERLGLFRLPRQPGDDPVIVETWI